MPRTRGTFKKGADARRGRGPKKGAPNAGRVPDAIKAEMRQDLRAALDKLRKRMSSRSPLTQLNNDELIRYAGLLARKVVRDPVKKLEHEMPKGLAISIVDETKNRHQHGADE